jgi:hypothetical protein
MIKSRPISVHIKPKNADHKDIEYTCRVCGNTFLQSWTIEEMKAEFKSRTGKDVSDAECVIVCDDCYKLMGVYQTPNKFFSAV